MKLTAKTRAEESKGAVKGARRAGRIPAVCYAPGGETQSIEIDETEFSTILRGIKPGRLSTTVFTLNLEGKSKKAIVKEVQYERTTYKVIHLDFEELKDGVLVQLKVPIECVGQAECAGIKLGGFLRQIVRDVKVKCLPKDIPSEFEIDIRDLKIKQSARLSDLKMPKGVQTVGTSDEVVAVIAKR